jgi:hypothetical protein
MQAHRNRIRELQDQETAIQLQVNQFTSDFFAPITDEAARNQSQVRRNEAQTRLDAVRRELADTRALVQQLEATGPPRAVQP